MRRLAAHVHINDDSGEHFVFGPGDIVPEWAQEKITNPKAWADEAQAAVTAVNPQPEAPPPAIASTDAPLERPPMAGAGSSGTEWIAYARSLGLDVADGTPRGDVIELVEEHEQAK